MKKFKFFTILYLLLYASLIHSQTGWFQQTSGTTYSINSIYFADVNTGYAAGDNFLILKTINGGSNWTVLFTGVYSLWSNYFLNTSTGYVAGVDGGIWVTHNSGGSWQ
jgi:photosystem II stability/assembly factor-like uncharacterized protein